MNDNALIALLISVIETGLAAQSITVGIKQSRQPTQQGAPTAPYIFLAKIGDMRYGFPMKSDVYNADTGVMLHTETENIRTSYQVSALAIQDPSNTASITASDYLNAAAISLQIDQAVSTLIASGVGIERITALKQTFFKDEKGKFEASPIFEFTVSHQRSVSYEIGSTDTVAGTVTSL